MRTLALVALFAIACGDQVSSVGIVNTETTSTADGGVQPDIARASSTSTSALDMSSPVTQTTGIKWHPGHYMSSDVYTTLGNTNEGSGAAGPAKAAEIDVVRSGPAAVVGWEGYYYWRALENEKDQFDFGGTSCPSTSGSGLDCDYIAITGWKSGSGMHAVYDSPRRMGIYILDTDYFADKNPTARAIPDYIANDSSYGPGADGTHYGYWTVTGGSGAGSGVAPAIYRAAVLARYEAMVHAIATHVLPDGYTVDTSPYIEWVKLYLETAAWEPEGNTDSTYSESTLISSLEALNASAATDFAHTNVVATSNWMAVGESSYTIEMSLPKTHTAAGGPDVWGYSAGTDALTWGQQAYIGLQASNSLDWQPGGTDLRGTVPYLATIQNTEMVQAFGAHFSASDLFEAADSTLHASHIAWQYLGVGYCGAPPGQDGGCGVTTDVLWFGAATSQAAWTQGDGGVLAEIVGSPVTHTACPSTYPSCDTR